MRNKAKISESKGKLDLFCFLYISNSVSDPYIQTVLARVSSELVWIMFYKECSVAGSLTCWLVSCAGLENLSHSLVDNSIETSCYSLLLFKGYTFFPLCLSVSLCNSVLGP